MTIDLRKKSDPVLPMAISEEIASYNGERPIQNKWQKIELSKTSFQWIDDNGQVRRVETYYKGNVLNTLKCLDEDGKFDGAQIENYPDGNLKSSTAYKHGLKHGIEKTFYNKKNIKERIFYVGGKIHGTRQSFHENGSLKLESRYQNDMITGLQYEYNANGQLSRKTHFENGLKNGWEESYSDQQLSSRSQYKDGKLHGLRQGFYNGRLTSEDNYQNGYKHGLSQTLDSSFGEFIETYYNHGKRNGNQTTYNLSGGIKRITPYVNDHSHGIGKMFDQRSGQLVDQYFWKSTSVSRAKYWLKSNADNITHLRISKLWSSLWNENANMITAPLHLQNPQQVADSKMLDISTFRNKLAS